MPLIDHRLFGQISNPQSLLSKPPTHPDDGKKYVRFVNKAKNRHYWLSQGALEPQERSDYIITPYVERNLLNLVRATSTRKFPILIQGPTSAGKTSMIEYLANFTGNKFVRINNHEHTDLQEYLGTYASDSNGKLRFQEGLLVQAMRQGHWIVLDELNLAPTDVLEALNRLLDDNRELLIPETQEIVRPHENFMLFSTQNPPGLYGGRKALSRAFRNRFLELHYDDIPEDELEYILQQRSRNTAPSDCKRIVTVYKELSRLRQTSRMFEQKDSFATLRDLFRWTQRSAEDREQIAINGFMLLAERVRVDEERIAVKEIIEKVFKVKIDPEQLYSTMFTGKGKSGENSQGVVWTGAMRHEDGDDNDMEEEAGEVDDLDPTTVDEKMWDGENEDEAEKEQQGEKAKGQQKDEQTAAADAQPNDESGDMEEPGEEQGDEGEDDDPAAEQEDVQFQEDIKQDQNVQQEDALALPDDMELDLKDEESGSDDDDLDDMSDSGEPKDDLPDLPEKHESDIEDDQQPEH
ncbi:hypothetical protein BN1723_016178, partial [Verticillium longisporum]